MTKERINEGGGPEELREVPSLEAAEDLDAPFVPKRINYEGRAAELARAEALLPETTMSDIAQQRKNPGILSQGQDPKKVPSAIIDGLKSVYALAARISKHFGRKRLPPMEDYLSSLVAEDEDLKNLRLETERLGGVKRMRSEESEAAFLAFLIETLSAKNVLEVGTFTGYGALSMAKALPADGRVVSLDISDKWPKIGKKYWTSSGVAERIDFRVGPADVGMRALLGESGEGSFDLIFIDANKDGYDEYYELALKLVRRGGIVAIDNVLWGGLVADAWVNDKETRALKALNLKIASDARVKQAIIPGWDGLTVARKR